MKEVKHQSHGTARWSINRAASEWGVTEQTMSQRLKTAGISAGEDRCFSTLEIDKAMHGDLEKEKIGLTCEQKKLTAVRRKREEGELAPIMLLETVGFELLSEHRQRIIYADYIPEPRKPEILAPLDAKHLQELFARSVAKYQQSLGDGESGDGDSDTASDLAMG